jgi:hypothetical protein
LIVGLVTEEKKEKSKRNKTQTDTEHKERFFSSLEHAHEHKPELQELGARKTSTKPEKLLNIRILQEQPFRSREIEAFSIGPMMKKSKKKSE